MHAWLFDGVCACAPARACAIEYCVFEGAWARHLTAYAAVSNARYPRPRALIASSLDNSGNVLVLNELSVGSDRGTLSLDYGTDIPHISPQREEARLTCGMHEGRALTVLVLLWYASGEPETRCVGLDSSLRRPAPADLLSRPWSGQYGVTLLSPLDHQLFSRGEEQITLQLHAHTDGPMNVSIHVDSMEVDWGFQVSMEVVMGITQINMPVNASLEHHGASWTYKLHVRYRPPGCVTHTCLGRSAPVILHWPDEHGRLFHTPPTSQADSSAWVIGEAESPIAIGQLLDDGAEIFVDGQMLCPVQSGALATLLYPKSFGAGAHHVSAQHLL